MRIKKRQSKLKQNFFSNQKNTKCIAEYIAK